MEYFDKCGMKEPRHFSFLPCRGNAFSNNEPSNYCCHVEVKQVHITKLWKLMFIKYRNKAKFPVEGFIFTNASSFS